MRRRFSFLARIFALLGVLPILAALAGPAFALAPSGITTAPDARLGAEIQKYIRKFEWVPEFGAAVVVIRHGKVIHLGTYGYRDRRAHQPVTENTLFAIGSTSKAFGAFATLLAAKDGLLKIDSPVKAYMPEFKLGDPALSPQITAVDLLSHRTGLAPFDALWLLTPYSRAQLVEKLRYLPLAYGPREQFQYNNLGIMTAAYLVEKVSGRTWEAFTQERIFKALEMNSSVFTTQAMVANPDHAIGYRQEQPMPLTPLDSVGPAGSINSSIKDMTNWLHMLIGKGSAHNGATLLSMDKFDRLLDENMLIAETEDWKTSYGLGWEIMRHKASGARLVQHTGGAAGYTAYVGFRPDPAFKDGVVILTNQHATAMPEQLSEQIFTYLSRPSGKEFDLPAESEKVVPFNPVLTIASDQKPPSTSTFNRSSWPGSYSHPAFGTIQITLVAGLLPVATFQGKNWNLVSANGREFYFTTDLWRGEPYTFEMALYTDPAGRVQELGIPFDFGFSENKFMIRAPVKFKRQN